MLRAVLRRTEVASLRLTLFHAARMVILQRTTQDAMSRGRRCQRRVQSKYCSLQRGFREKMPQATFCFTLSGGSDAIQRQAANQMGSKESSAGDLLDRSLIVDLPVI